MIVQDTASSLRFYIWPKPKDEMPHTNATAYVVSSHGVYVCGTTVRGTAPSRSWRFSNDQNLLDYGYERVASFQEVLNRCPYSHYSHAVNLDPAYLQRLEDLGSGIRRPNAMSLGVFHDCP